MIARPRGRRVVFAEADAQHPAQTAPIGTRRFAVPLLGYSKPVTIIIDLSGWSREPLARAFAVALREDLLSPRTVCTRSLIGTRVRELRRFWQFLDVTRVPLQDVAAITPPLLDEYEQWLEQHQPGGSIHRRHLLARPLSLLRIMEERRAGTLNPTTVERLAYVSLAPYGRSVPRDAYSGAVSNALRRAARTQVLSAASRIAPEGTLPAVPEGLHACVQDRYAKVLREIERRGSLPQKHPLYDSLQQRATYWHTPSAPPIRWEAVHAQFHLTALDVVGFLVILALETGLEIESLTRLKADCLKNPVKGFVEIEYCKRRARGSEWRRLRVRDGGVNTPGGLIRLALRLSARARRHKGTDALWVYLCIFGFVEGVNHLCILARYFVRHHALVGDDGQPLRLVLSRLRKTQKAEWYIKTQGQLEEFAIGHSPHVAANHYADIPALHHLHEQTVAEALQDALDDALKPTIVPPSEEHAMRTDPRRASLPIPPQEVTAFLDGAQDLWLASCSGFYDSPFGTKGRPCPVPFWGCLECVNAVITSRKLPALIAFLNFMTVQRESLAAADWTAKFAHAYRRIAEQILPAFPEADVLAARAIAASIEGALYLPPEARAR